MTENQIIYNSWAEELAFRGTEKIKRKASSIKGWGLTNGNPSTLEIEVSIKTPINIFDDEDNDFKFEFDIEFINYSTRFLIDSVSGISFYFLDSTTIKFVNGLTTYSLTNLDLTQYTGINRFKLIRVALTGKMYIYINDIKLGEITGIPSLSIEIDKLFLLRDTISNVRLTRYKIYGYPVVLFEPQIEYNWKMNEGSGVVIEELTDNNYSCSINIPLNTTFTDVWVQNDIFNNVESSDLDGELIRLLNNTEEELIFELIKTSEQGLCLDISSPMSSEANCENLNKAFEKGKVSQLSKYPIYVDPSNNSSVSIDGDAIKIHIDGTETGWVGVNKPLYTQPILSSNTFMKPNGLIPFIPIPVQPSGDYLGFEVSFKIKSSANIDLLFGLIGYGNDFTPVADAFRTYSAPPGHLNNFMNETDFSLCNSSVNNNSYLLVRGVIANQLIMAPQLISSSTNLGLGWNLCYDLYFVRYIVPYILLKQTIGSTDVWIKDIVIRPLSLSTEKGVVNSKNVIMGWLKNNSGRSREEVLSFIEQKLIPVNCSTNIKFI